MSNETQTNGDAGVECETMLKESVTATPSSPHNTLQYASDRSNNESYILPGGKLAIVFLGFILSFTLIALDQTILSTALPTIASHFSAVADLSWIASAYFLPQAGLMLLFGRVLAITPSKPVLLFSIVVFEVGSLMCAAAPAVQVLISGRAIAGVGAAGIWMAIMSIIAQISTMAQRPLLLGLFGAVFAVASIAGPLLGGAFSDHVSWRWCFWINLPFGGLAFLIIVLVLPNNPPAEKSTLSTSEKWMRVDWIGAVLSIALCTMLLIPLQWAGNGKDWGNAVIISLLVVSSVLIALFLIWEHRQKDGAIMPTKFIKNRSILGVCLESFFCYMCFVIASYYLPLYYQLEGHSATKSGLDILPFMISGVLASVLAGGIVTKTGHAWPFLFVTPMIASVAYGLLFTVTSNTANSKLFGYQILLGVGLGCVLQNTVVIAQSQYVNSPELVPQATSVVMFSQLLGSSVGLAIAGAVFSTRLDSELSTHAPFLAPDIRQLVRQSILAVRSLPPDTRAPVVAAYTSSINAVWMIGVAAAALSSLLAFLISRSKVVMKVGATL